MRIIKNHAVKKNLQGFVIRLRFPIKKQYHAGKL